MLGDVTVSAAAVLGGVWEVLGDVAVSAAAVLGGVWEGIGDVVAIQVLSGGVGGAW